MPVSDEDFVYETLVLEATLPSLPPRGFRRLVWVQESVRICCSGNSCISVAGTSQNWLLIHVTRGCGWAVAFVQAAGDRGSVPRVLSFWNRSSCLGPLLLVSVNPGGWIDSTIGLKATP